MFMGAKLKPVYTIVAREVALGLDLRDICEARKLNLESMRRVTRGELFKAEVARLQGIIEEEMVTSAIEDPVLSKLKALSYNAVGRLADEMDNYDEETGASAATRLSASKAILDKAGYSGKKDENEGNKVIILSLSQEKLKSVKSVDIDAVLVQEVPDSVDGHLKKLA
jgi:hypothetical protein